MNSKLNVCDIIVVNILSSASANVLPKQTRFPPLNGHQLACGRFFPSGVSESGWDKSKRSGLKFYGSFQSFELWCIG